MRPYSNYEIVVIAVALLGGESEVIDREDVAVKVSSLAPGRFSWRKYPDQIDLDSVGVALRDAKKSKNGALLVGDNTSGWMLSRNGVKWITSV